MMALTQFNNHCDFFQAIKKIIIWGKWVNNTVDPKKNPGCFVNGSHSNTINFHLVKCEVIVEDQTIIKLGMHTCRMRNGT